MTSGGLVWNYAKPRGDFRGLFLLMAEVSLMLVYQFLSNKYLNV
jgi:hypothetical protein